MSATVVLMCKWRGRRWHFLDSWDDEQDSPFESNIFCNDPPAIADADVMEEEAAEAGENASAIVAVVNKMHVDFAMNLIYCIFVYLFWM